MQQQFLYGASIHGIQDIIFETNKLKEILGASEIIEKICKEFHTSQELFGDLGLSQQDFILQAAGNIKLIADEDKVKSIVKYFPMKVAKLLPGVVVSQAVIEIAQGVKAQDFKELNRRLKIQRNRIMRTAQTGHSVVKRAPRTGRPTHKKDKHGEFIDFATAQKREHVHSNRFEDVLLGDRNSIDDVKLVLADNEEKIANEKNKNWIAVCHADGNGLGQVLINMAQNSEGLSSEKITELYRNFSQQVEKANTAALKDAFRDIVYKNAEDEIGSSDFKGKSYAIPFRPILMGGDDLTFVCRADLAVPFVAKYIECFEKYTQQEVSCVKGGLTACAGVAFIKKNYPFHYGYSLADELCAHAKKVSREEKKDIAPSSIAFHKVHSSFHSGYEDIVERELKIGNTSLQFGPYAIRQQTQMSQLPHLLACACELQKDGAPKSGLRKWLGELSNNELAQQLLERVFSISEENAQFDLNTFAGLLKNLHHNLETNPQRAQLIVQMKDERKTPIHDLLTIISVGEVVCPQ